MNQPNEKLVELVVAASTARDLGAKKVTLVALYQPVSITVMVTHALFVGDALARIKLAGADQVWSCDSVIHPTNRVGLAKTLAQALIDPGAV